MAKAVFPETTGYESNKPADAGSWLASDMRNALSALYQGDISPLRARAQASQNMTIAVNPSSINSYYQNVWGFSRQPIIYAGGNTSAITAPASNPRIDIVYLTSAGALAIVTGAEAGSPVPLWANLPMDGVPICLIYCKTTMTKIYNYEEKDANPTHGYIYADIRPFFVSAIPQKKATFTNADLVAGVLTVTHNQNLTAPYGANVRIFDNTNMEVIPDNCTGSANSMAVDLSSYGTITGTWQYIMQF